VIDRDLVTRKMVLITGDVNALAPFAAKPLADYLRSETDEMVVERRLERIIGRMIDINYHLITEADQPPPPDYYDSFVQLGRLGILPVAFASEIAACAGLRNRIVHEYDEIDPARVHEALQVAMKDVPAYLAHVQEHLGRIAPG